ncbi:hypothetical protein [Kribbella sp. VKM Ac-2568]|uniref:hypothetical protein n=1 Tax=Kribbella sp. VKM Ac-2568 TaxID=2512219 RepID=UPI0010540746|nr:hypothetical protein [Kribbella sp. VKM Ac-2568]
MLNLDQHLRYERESLSRYPRNPDGTIEWGPVPDGLVLSSMDSDSVELSTAIQHATPNAGSLIFFWGSLAVPTVEMGLEFTVTHLSDITESVPEFWIYSPSDRVVVELSFSGVVTAANMPVDMDDRGTA